MDVFDFYNWSQRRLTFHGSAVEIACACEELVPAIDHLLYPFREASFPDGFVPLRGVIEPYDLDDVLKHLSLKAKPLLRPDQLFELYRDGDRYFRLDDSVGLTMVDLSRRRWQCWLTPEALAGDPIRLIDAAILWPLAQLVSGRELHLLPAVSVARNGFGVMLLSDLPLEPELDALVHGGYQIVGQRWTALREEDNGRIAMLHLPGHVLAKSTPTGPHAPAMQAADRWIDLQAGRPQSIKHHAFCDLILICSLGRREQIRVKPFSWAAAMNTLRRNWPTVDLPPGRRGGKLVSKMASRIRVAELQLSRDPAALLQVIDLLRRTPAPPHLAPVNVPVASSMVGSWTKPPVYRPARQSA